ncbi:single-stranded DNA-binding protein [Ancylobacter moscoviensis]
MAGSVNKAILIGHLGRDPEVRTFQNGGRLVTFRLATSESWRDKASGERREITQWHTVVVFNEQLAPIAEQYLRKGSKVYVEGQIETCEHVDQAGIKRYYTEIVLRPFRGAIALLDKADTGSRGRPEDYERSTTPRESPAANAPPAGSTADLDDEIPF